MDVRFAEAHGNRILGLVMRARRAVSPGVFLVVFPVLLVSLVGLGEVLPIWLYDCNGDGIADCWTSVGISMYISGAPSASPTEVSGCGTQCRYVGPWYGTPSAGVRPCSKCSDCSACSATAVQFGGYTLKFTDLIKCASVEGRPYTSGIIGAVGGESWVHLPQVLLDSGADISVLPIWVAKTLGIDLSECDTREYQGVGGGTVLGYLAEIQIGITHLGGVDPDIDGYILAENGASFLPVIAVAFIEDDSTYILGRVDVFDVLDLDFTSDTVTIRIAD